MYIYYVRHKMTGIYGNKCRHPSIPSADKFCKGPQKKDIKSLYRDVRRYLHNNFIVHKIFNNGYRWPLRLFGLRKGRTSFFTLYILNCFNFLIYITLAIEGKSVNPTASNSILLKNRDNLIRIGVIF